MVEILTMSVGERKRLEVMSRVISSELSFASASEILRISYRQAKRIAARYKSEGDSGLVHRLRGKASNRTGDRQFRERVLSRYSEVYADYGPTLAAEELDQEGLARLAPCGSRNSDQQNETVNMPDAELIAYHEAGHALMALLLGGKVKQVTIEPDNDDGPDRQGDTQILWHRSGVSDKEFAKRAVQVCLAGPVAEMIYSGDSYHPGLVAEWAADWREAWDAAERLYADERLRLKFLEQVSIQLYHRLKADDRWGALAALADNLLAHETLEGEQVEEIVEQWLW